jgi:hypothetical protein
MPVLNEFLTHTRLMMELYEVGPDAAKALERPPQPKRPVM